MGKEYAFSIFLCTINILTPAASRRGQHPGLLLVDWDCEGDGGLARIVDEAERVREPVQAAQEHRLTALPNFRSINEPLPFCLTHCLLS